ncbi:MAG: hypothetical protein HZB51_23720 [Chloroflexi bacterium]|nr:hypothetical protein [Chloroflexota bacterium]
MKGKNKLSLIPLIIVGLSMILASCSAAADTYTEGAARFDLLVLRIRVNHPKQLCLKSGDSLDIRFTVSNVGNELFVLETKDSPVLDIVIREYGRSIYAWAEQNPGQVQHRVEWQPGESKTVNVKWQLPQKEYAHEALQIAGLISETDVRYGQRTAQSAFITLCLGYPPAVDDAITPTPKAK